MKPCAIILAAMMLVSCEVSQRDGGKRIAEQVPEEYREMFQRQVDWMYDFCRRKNLRPIEERQWRIRIVDAVPERLRDELPANTLAWIEPWYNNIYFRRPEGLHSWIIRHELMHAVQWTNGFELTHDQTDKWEREERHR